MRISDPSALWRHGGAEESGTGPLLCPCSPHKGKPRVTLRMQLVGGLRRGAQAARLCASLQVTHVAIEAKVNSCRSTAVAKPDGAA